MSIKPRKKKKRKKKSRREQWLSSPTRSLARNPTANRLDSVFLCLCLKRNDEKSRRLAAVPKEMLLKSLQDEIEKFADLKKIDVVMKEKFRLALMAIINDPDKIAKIVAERSGKKLRSLWVDEVKKGYNEIFIDYPVSREPSMLNSSAVDNFLNSLDEQLPHPRGEDIPHPEGGNDSLSDSSVSSFGSLEPAASVAPAPTENPDVPQEDPLVFDDEARRAVKLMRETERPEDIKNRTATFIADRLFFGSSYIIDMLQGRTKWPSWSRQQLHLACSKVVDMYEAKEVRMAIAEDLGAKARAALLKRESDMLRAIRTFLHIARLGPGGGKRLQGQSHNGGGA